MGGNHEPGRQYHGKGLTILESRACKGSFQRECIHSLRLGPNSEGNYTPSLLTGEGMKSPAFVNGA
jgi:hypothetical protein